MTPVEQKEYVLKRIHLIDNIQMSDELFKIKSEQYAKYLIDKYGFELVSNLSLLADFTNNYWQLKFINKI
jgi:hypothetical protein